MALIERVLQLATSAIWAVARDLLIIISRISLCYETARFGAMSDVWIPTCSWYGRKSRRYRDAEQNLRIMQTFRTWCRWSFLAWFSSTDFMRKGPRDCGIANGVSGSHLHRETEHANTNFLPLSTFTHHQPSNYHHIAMDLLSKDQRLQLVIEAR